MSRMSLSFSAESTKAASSRRTPRGATARLRATAADRRSLGIGKGSGIPLARSGVWLRQMLRVDFRHAFWPWVVYLVGVAAFPFYEGSVFSWMFGISIQTTWGLAIVAVAAPAVIVRVFCTDFGHGTAERLLSAPVSRMMVWWARYGLVCGLLLIPMAVSLVCLPEDAIKNPFIDKVYYAWQHGSLALLTVIFHLTVGMLCVMLRRPLLAWSAIVVSPLLMLIVLAFVNSFIASVWSMRIGSLFLPPPYVIPFIIVAVPIAARLWRRLEVRS